MTRFHTTGFLALAVTALIGCGTETASIPDTAPPLAPELLSGYSKTEGLVVLNWSPNVESDLAGYQIYEVGVTDPIGFAPAGSRGVSFESSLAGPTPFRITAIDRSGNESAPSRIMAVEYAAPPTPEPDNMVELRG
ncbi:MAG: hypothetical protein SGI90_13370 [Candidatus Eisenbacteria bacterium]|nr:hypothetical protein [Candidatus Eisenbacteria bacterium]